MTGLHERPAAVYIALFDSLLVVVDNVYLVDTL